MWMNRRAFSGWATLALGGLAGKPASEAGAEPRGEQAGEGPGADHPAGRTPGALGGYIRSGMIETVRERFDLIVVGGGIAGTCAAISAARNGVKVALVHERSTLGGNSSSEVRLYPENTCSFSPWCREGGILDEIYTEERARNWEPYIEGIMNSHWDLVLYEWAKRERNLTLLLNTTMQEVEMADEAHILGIHGVQLGTEKRFLLQAPLFVDATGDGVLIYRSGAEFRKGKEARQEYHEPLAPEQASEAVMGNTLFFRARDTGRPVEFKRPAWAAEFKTDSELPGRSHGFIRGGYWWIEAGYPLDWIRDNEQIRDELLRQMLGVWDHIKNRCTDGDIRARARNYALEFIGFWPYKRESRRLISDYILREQDVRDPVARPDDIAYGVWGIDIHAPGGILDRNIPPYPPPRSDENFEKRSTIPYGIPLRSCYSRNVVNLMAAGRPIGASYIAFASSRVLPTGAITGQSVGAAAGLCKKYACLPRTVAKSHSRELQQILLRQDASIPGVENSDAADLARTATVTASSESALVFAESDHYHKARFPLAQIFPVSSDHLDRVELLLRSFADVKVPLTLHLQKVSHVWDFRSAGEIAQASAVLPPGYKGYLPFTFNLHTEPGSLYCISLDRDDRVGWALWSDAEGAPTAVPVGVTPADRPGPSKWRPLTGGKTFSMRVFPVQHPYSPGNVVHGTNRPDRWTNIWISDLDRGLPAWIVLQLPRQAHLNQVQITFDDNINVRVRLPLFRYPECVSDYEISAWTGSGWKDVAAATGNYHRRVVHNFPGIAADKIRITLHKTNGVAAARIYEVRIYDEAVTPMSAEEGRRHGSTAT